MSQQTHEGATPRRARLGGLACAAIAVLAVQACQVHHRVWHVDPEIEPEREGVVYSLPKTKVTVSMPVTSVETKRGEFYDELDKAIDERDPASPDFIGLNREQRVARLMEDDRVEAIKEDLEQRGILNEGEFEMLLAGQFRKRKITVGKASLTTQAVWDEDLLFLVEWPSKPNEARTLSISLNEAGFMTSVNVAAKDQTLDVALKVVEAAASIAGRFFFGGATASLDSTDPRVSFNPTPEPLSDPIQKILLRANQAIGEYDEIQRQLRTMPLLATGNGGSAIALYDKAALEFRMEHLKKERDRLVKFFLVDRKVEWAASFSGLPDSDGRSELLQVVTETPEQPEQGVWMSLAVQSDPTFALDSAVPAELLGTRGLGKQSSVAHSISLRSLRPVAWPNQVAEPKGGSLGFRYRVPGEVVITHDVQKGGSAESSEQGRWTEMIAQFGPVRALPTGVGTSDASIKIALHPKLGSLKAVDAASKVTLADQVGSLRSATDSVLNTLSEPTELDRLNQENALLEAQEESATERRTRRRVAGARMHCVTTGSRIALQHEQDA
ncbi:MAG: hypothetical protein ACFHWZ_16980 [Phycisphaerales bacterium]